MPVCTSPEVAPPRVSEALVLVDSLPWERSVRSLLAWPGVSAVLLGAKVRSLGAEPAGRVLAWNSGTASLPTSTPGLCCWIGRLVRVLDDG